MPELKYEITQKVGVLSESNRGWTKELKYVSWNEREARLDLREWSPNHDRMGKGVTLSKEEAVKLKELLNSIEL